MPYQIGTSVGTLADADGIFGVDPNAPYSEGEPAQTLGGTLAYRGKPRSTWRFAALPVTTWASIKTTYLSGDLSGEVYVRTRDDDDSWTNYRAIMNLPDPASLSRWSGHYLDVEIEFILLEVAT